MVSRRKFLGVLAALPAITALAGSGLLLPRRKNIEVEVCQYFTGTGSWYLKMDVQEAQEFREFNRASAAADLSEKSIEHMLNQLRDNEVLSMYQVRPTKLIVHPDMAARAYAVLTHKPTLFERFMWRLFPID